MIKPAECPRVLVAMPGLNDPNFFKAVVLLIEHNEHGAFGLIVNKPSKMSLASVLEENGPTIPSDLKVWFGGPVEPNLGIILKSNGPSVLEREESKEVEGETTESESMRSTPFALLSNQEALNRMVEAHVAKKNLSFQSQKYAQRFVVGSAGWGPGQLEEELQGGSWLELDFSSNLIFNTKSEDMWNKAFASVGIIADNVIPLFQFSAAQH